MPINTKSDDSYERFSASVKAGRIGKLYIFHGEERYLLERSLGDLRRLLCPDGLGSFNYKRFEGKDINTVALEETIDTLPVLAERTFIEVHDFDLFKGKKTSETDIEDKGTPKSTKRAKSTERDEKQILAELFQNLPDYVCVVFVYDTILYKPDGRLKLDKELLGHAQVVDFAIQEQSKLIKWITRHFEAAGKRISGHDAGYLALITDGYMATLVGEIEKVAAYSDGASVTRTDIDAVVTPVPSAFAYKLTDALFERKNSVAMQILDELFQMREPAHKIIYNISLKMRQLLAARVCIDNSLGKDALMSICGIRYDFQASTLLQTARKTSLSKCRDLVLLCAEAANDLNSTPEPEARLVELIARLAYNT